MITLKKNTGEELLAVQPLKNLIRSFYKENFKKLTIIFLPIGSGLFIAMTTIKLIKLKQGRLAKNVNKKVKNLILDPINIKPIFLIYQLAIK